MRAYSRLSVPHMVLRLKQVNFKAWLHDLKNCLVCKGSEEIEEKKARFGWGIKIEGFNQIKEFLHQSTPQNISLMILRKKNFWY